MRVDGVVRGHHRIARVERVGGVADALVQFGHFRDAAGVIRHRSVRVRG